jgi:hypothetical protein
VVSAAGCWSMYQYCRWQGDNKTRALCLTVRLGQQESVAFSIFVRIRTMCYSRDCIDMYGIIGMKTHIFEAKQYRKYTVKKLVCVQMILMWRKNNVLVKKKRYFGKEHNRKLTIK